MWVDLGPNLYFYSDSNRKMWALMVYSQNLLSGDSPLLGLAVIRSARAKPPITHANTHKC